MQAWLNSHFDRVVDYAKAVGDSTLVNTLETWERVPKRGR